MKRLLSLLKFLFCSHPAMTSWKLHTRTFGDGIVIDVARRSCKCCGGWEQEDLKQF